MSDQQERLGHSGLKQHCHCRQALKLQFVPYAGISGCAILIGCIWRQCQYLFSAPSWWLAVWPSRPSFLRGLQAQHSAGGAMTVPLPPGSQAAVRPACWRTLAAFLFWARFQPACTTAAMGVEEWMTGLREGDVRWSAQTTSEWLRNPHRLY